MEDWAKAKFHYQRSIRFRKRWNNTEQVSRAILSFPERKKRGPLNVYRIVVERKSSRKLRKKRDRKKKSAKLVVECFLKRFELSSRSVLVESLAFPVPTFNGSWEGRWVAIIQSLCFTNCLSSEFLIIKNSSKLLIQPLPANCHHVGLWTSTSSPCLTKWLIGFLDAHTSFSRNDLHLFRRVSFCVLISTPEVSHIFTQYMDRKGMA